MPDLDLLATQTRLVIRRSPKFSPGGFLQSLLSSVATGMASLNQIVGDLKDRVDAPMLRQSLHERFDIVSTQAIEPPIETASPSSPRRQKCCVPTLRYFGRLRSHSKNAHQRTPPNVNHSAFIVLCPSVAPRVQQLSANVLEYPKSSSSRGKP